VNGMVNRDKERVGTGRISLMLIYFERLDACVYLAEIVEKGSGVA